MVPRMDPSLARQLSGLVDQISTIVVGKRPQIEDCVACLLAAGHLLIEDVPGVGKTTLAHALAVSLGLDFRRVQFTADLMPSDLIGVSVFERSKEAFVFHQGPVFAQVLLADEINRAGPKTQSALLEAMEEQQVSVENETRPLPHPFFVIATQNPSDQLGTYPLPESQLDRFLLRITLGYPDRAAERELLAGGDRRAAAMRLQPLMRPGQLEAAQQAVLQVRAADARPAIADKNEDLQIGVGQLDARSICQAASVQTMKGIDDEVLVTETLAADVSDEGDTLGIQAQLDQRSVQVVQDQRVPAPGAEREGQGGLVQVRGKGCASAGSVRGRHAATSSRIWSAVMSSPSTRLTPRTSTKS